MLLSKLNLVKKTVKYGVGSFELVMLREKTNCWKIKPLVFSNFLLVLTKFLFQEGA